VIDDWLDAYEFEERHGTDIRGTADEIGRALRELPIDDVPVARGLWAARVLPARIGGKPAPAPATGPLLDQLVGLGGVVLEDRSGLLVAGLAGPFWKLSGRLERFEDAEEFRSFDAAASAKAVVDFAWRDGRLDTTTRVHVPDAAARRRFRRYWLLVRPFSGAIRIAVLRAVRLRVERVSTIGG
jgi:hypothetical protein